MSLNFD